MIRVVFDNGEIIDCEHISKIYIEEGDMENLTIVGRDESINDVRLMLMQISHDIPKGENDGIDS